MLATSPRQSIPRATLAARLWELSDPSHADASLRQSLSIIGKLLAPIREDWLLNCDTTLHLNGSAFETDVCQLSTLLTQNDTRALKEVAQSYSGKFMEGVSFSEPAMQSWLTHERANVTRLLSAATVRLIDHAERVNDWPAIVSFGQKLIEIDPIDERGHRAVITALKAQGRHSEALAQYRLCCAELTRHDIPAPEPQTTALVLSSRRQPINSVHVNAEPPKELQSKETPRIARGPTLAVMPFSTHSPDSGSTNHCKGSAGISGT